jgi:hypothetical protein
MRNITTDRPSVKFTAAHVDTVPQDLIHACVAVDSDIVRLDKHETRASGYHIKLKERRTAIGQRLLEIQKRCDKGGFKALCERFLSKHSRTRIFALIAVAKGRKSDEASLEANRLRVRRFRARAAQAESITSACNGLEAAADRESLFERIQKTPKGELMGALDRYGVDAFLEVASADFMRQLRERMPDPFMLLAAMDPYEGVNKFLEHMPPFKAGIFALELIAKLRKQRKAGKGRNSAPKKTPQLHLVGSRDLSTAA